MEHQQPDNSAGLGRRRFIVGSAAGAAIAWSVPSITTIDAAAAGTKATPQHFAGGDAFDLAINGSTLSNYVRTVTLTSGTTTNPVNPGDLWIGVIAFDVRETVNGLPATGTNVATWGPIDRNSGTSVSPAVKEDYSVRAWVVARVLTASDITSGVHQVTFTSNNAAIDRGSLRAAALVYRDPLGGQMTLPTGTTDSGFGPPNSSAGGPINATFPAIAPAPTSPNQVLSIGVARGYGGWNALEPDISWLSGPGAHRINFNGHNPSTGHATGGSLTTVNDHGGRAIWISEQADSDGSAAAGTWYKQPDRSVFGNPKTENWVTFSLALEA